LKGIFAILVVLTFFSACRKFPEPANPALEKSTKFQAYSDALSDCGGTSVDSALRCVKDIYDIDTLSDIDHEIWNNYGLATAYHFNNQDLEASEVISELLPETESLELLFERAELLHLRSQIYNGSNKLLLAAEDKYQAANIYQQLGLNGKASLSYMEIANLHYKTGNYLFTVENARISMRLITNMKEKIAGDSLRLMWVTNTLALGYNQLGQLDSAMKYFDLSYDLANNLEDEFWAGLVTGNKAIVYQKKGQYEEAIENLKVDIRLSLKHNELSSAASSLIMIGEIFFLNNDLKQSRIFCDSAFLFLEKKRDPSRLSNYYDMMSRWYEKHGDFDSSLLFYRKHIIFRDSVQSVHLNAQLQQIQNEKQFENQLIDYNLLKAENELRKNDLLVSNISIVTFLIISVLLLVLLYTIRRNNRKLKELNQSLENKVATRTARLRIINKELDTYLYRVSHDVRRPILTILGLLQVAEITGNDERTTIRKIIRKTANEMDRMLMKLQMAYNLDKEDKGDKLLINLNSYLKEKILELNKDFPGTVIDLKESVNVDIKLNLPLLNMVIFNILENACVFSLNGNNTVNVFLEGTDEDVLIRVHDNGIGIDQAFLDDIFEPYKRFHNKSTGSGLGLHLAKRAIRKIGGQIHVKSVLGKESEFCIYIPFKSRWYKEN
jgi:signal transduction histidine kinase